MKDNNQEVVIKVENVYKDFILPHERVGSVKGVFTSMFSKATRTKEKQHALKNISFEIKKGEFFGIVGRNGSGKSTLLKILAQIYQPTKGNISTSGKLVPFIELGVGFNPELSGRDNVYLNGAMLGFSVKEIDSMYNSIVDFAELERFMDQKLKNYSTGMQVRLAFAMATKSQADILLVDEVLAVGDADFQRKCFSYFKNLKKENKTVIFVSHDMNAVREYCDRAVLIENSKIIAEGKPNLIAMQYNRVMTGTKPTEGMGIEVSTDTKRWGDGAVKYEEVHVEPSHIENQKSITIISRAKAKQSISGPIFGFTIKNEADEYLLGTNTKLRQIKPITLKKGERVVVKWTIPNIFTDGTYFVNPAVEHSDGITECDWFEEAAKFTVNRDERTPYPIKPDITVNLEKAT